MSVSVSRGPLIITMIIRPKLDNLQFAKARLRLLSGPHDVPEKQAESQQSVVILQVEKLRPKLRALTWSTETLNHRLLISLTQPEPRQAAVTSLPPGPKVDGL